MKNISEDKYQRYSIVTRRKNSVTAAKIIEKSMKNRHGVIKRVSNDGGMWHDRPRDDIFSA